MARETFICSSMLFLQKSSIELHPVFKMGDFPPMQKFKETVKDVGLDS